VQWVVVQFSKEDYIRILASFKHFLIGYLFSFLIKNEESGLSCASRGDAERAKKSIQKKKRGDADIAITRILPQVYENNNKYLLRFGSK
jgi:hypothetical protein